MDGHDYAGEPVTAATTTPTQAAPRSRPREPRIPALAAIAVVVILRATIPTAPGRAPAATAPATGEAASLLGQDGFTFSTNMAGDFGSTVTSVALGVSGGQGDLVIVTDNDVGAAGLAGQMQSGAASSRADLAPGSPDSGNGNVIRLIGTLGQL